MAGINFHTVKDAPLSASYDEYAYWRTMDDYVYNVGAMDYAISVNATYYVGSYHGGESLISQSFTVDSEAISTFPAVGKTIQINQRTNIDDKLTSDTVQKWAEDGVYRFAADITGEMDVFTFYTALTTTSDEFDLITYPVEKDLNEVENGKDFVLGNVDTVTQKNVKTGQSITTYLQLFDKSYNDKGVFVRRVDGGYNKVYYGKIYQQNATVEDIIFKTIREFK